MNPADQHNQDDLERRLRDAFAAKAMQVSDADLDPDREDEVAAALSSQRRSSPVTRIFAGIGAAAAAAAIVAVTVVGLHHDGKHEVVNGLPPAMTTSSASTTASTTTSTRGSADATRSPALNQPGTPGNGHATALPSTGASTAGSAPSSETTTPLSPNHTALSGSSTVTSNSSASTLSAASHEPPAMSPGLPQSGRLGDQEYTGAVPLKDPSGGKPRMLSMPSDTTWQRTAEGGNSLTVRITYVPTDIEAYWNQTLPGEGWVKDGSGWSYPDTSYTVSAITDKGSFTVTW